MGQSVEQDVTTKFGVSILFCCVTLFYDPREALIYNSGRRQGGNLSNKTNRRDVCVYTLVFFVESR